MGSGDPGLDAPAGEDENSNLCRTGTPTPPSSSSPSPPPTSARSLATATPANHRALSPLGSATSGLFVPSPRNRPTSAPRQGSADNHRVGPSVTGHPSIRPASHWKLAEPLFVFTVKGGTPRKASLAAHPLPAAGLWPRPRNIAKPGVISGPIPPASVA